MIPGKEYEVKPLIWPAYIAAIFLAASGHPWWVFVSMLVGNAIVVRVKA